MRALVVVNPAATATTPTCRDVLVRALAGELKVDVVETEHRGHGRELGRRAAEDGVDVVVTLGGDGTVNEVVNGLLEGGPSAHVPTLAVVPGGATHVVSRGLGRRPNPIGATAESPRRRPPPAAGHPACPGGPWPAPPPRRGRPPRSSPRCGPAAPAGSPWGRRAPRRRTGGPRRAGSSSPPGSASTPTSSPASRRSAP